MRQKCFRRSIGFYTPAIDGLSIVRSVFVRETLTLIAVALACVMMYRCVPSVVRT